jgi:L-seryl-tRNA(Ser) seleniumtransferase
MNTGAEPFKDIPGVDTLLNSPEIKSLSTSYPRQLIVYSIQSILDLYREQMISGAPAPSREEIIGSVKRELSKLTRPGLKKVINASGVIIHTNLGRAPIDKMVLGQAQEILCGYSNLEFDMPEAKRGSRYVHLAPILRHLTDAEDILVVNNNAAAVMLILHNLAYRKEVIISRGELIEIGGSFRMPDIMRVSGCKMVEVGTTNKTRIADYEQAISNKTAILFKAHRSNYLIKGFTQQPSLNELVELGKKSGIPVVYDMGSGLLKKSGIEILKDEPNVMQTLSTGVDLVCFSGDKLLGGPQAGIIAGNKELIARLKKDPMTRALRVGKATLALLEAVCRQYLDDAKLIAAIPVFRMMNRTSGELHMMAVLLQKELHAFGISSEIVPNTGQTGGGSLPEAEINSFAVEITGAFKTGRERAAFSEKLYRGLLVHETPVLGILRKGRVLLDVLTLHPSEIPQVAMTTRDVYNSLLP